ncbi:hydrogenase maturation protease [Nocardia xishanensis]
MLVAGIGNIFLSDDGFGPAVVRRLPPHREPSVRITDYGIRGMHLAYDLLDDWDALVLVDALPDRGAPGKVEVFDADETNDPVTQLDAHAMNPDAVFSMVRTLGGTVPPTVVVGCQIVSVAEGIGLTDPVEAALATAADAVDSVVAELLDRQEV